MHFKPKSLLIEVGAQTNTLQEAKNAIGPACGCAAPGHTGVRTTPFFS